MKTQMAVSVADELGTDFLHYVIILTLLLLPVFYELSQTFKFYTKFFFYYLTCFSAGWLTIAYAFLLCRLRPNARNIWLAVRIFRLVTRLFGLQIEQRGTKYIPDGPAIFVCNHQSTIDVLGMMEVWPQQCVPIAKRSLFWTGPFGLGLWCSDCIFIDRFNPSSARQTMEKNALQISKRNLKVWVFPEGTRNHEGGMLPFKKGAFHLAIQARIPIVPVVFSSYSEFYSKKERRFEAGRFVVSFLQPVSTKGLPPEQVDQLLVDVRKRMLDVFHETSLETAQSRLSNGCVR